MMMSFGADYQSRWSATFAVEFSVAHFVLDLMKHLMMMIFLLMTLSRFLSTDRISSARSPAIVAAGYFSSVETRFLLLDILQR
jgi:hypothetical protein